MNDATSDDITDFRDDDAARESDAEELAQQSREQLVGHLAASVAHDFNNLLAIISGANTLLGLETRDNAQAVELVGEIDVAVQRASGLVRALLGRLRGAAPVAAATDLNEVLGELRPLVERLAGANIEVRLECDAATHPVVVVQEAFENAVLNLVANARDAMHHGGQLTIATHDVVLEEDPSGGPGTHYVAIVVNDTGAGMSSAVRDRAFGRLFTTKESGRGSGLGLNAVRRFAADSRGCVSVHSTEGLGTSVWIYLPCPESRGAREPHLQVDPLDEAAPDSAV